MGKKNFKKSLIVCAMAVIMAFAISGCEFLAVYGIHIHKDGSAEVTVKTLLDEEFYEALTSMGEDSSDDNDYEQIEYDGEDYYGTEETTDCDDIDELIETLEDSEAFDDIEITPYSFSATYVPSEGEDGADVAEMKDNGVNVSAIISVTFDSKIVDTNGKISKDDPNTVTWELTDMDEETELYAKAQSINWVLIISIIIGVIVVAAIIVIVVILTSKKKNAVPPTTDETPVQE